MNVVSLPALANTFAAAAEGLLCMEGTCLFGWAWSIVALTFLSAVIVQGWRGGGAAERHLLTVSSSPAPANAGALLPRLPGVVAAQTRVSARPVAEPAACLSLRAPPLTFERAVPVSNPADLPSSFPSRCPDPRSPGTPAAPASPPDAPGQPPPA